MPVAQPMPVDYLQDDETTKLAAGRHAWSVVDELVGGVILAALPITAALVFVLGWRPLLMLPLAVPIIAFVLAWFTVFVVSRVWRVQTSVYTLTDARAYAAHGRIRFFLAQTTYDKLTDVHVKQTLFGRIWGFGTVRLETAGTGIALDGIRNPFEVKQVLEDARSAFLRQLIGSHKRRPATAERPAAPATTTQLWSSGPTALSMLGRMITVGILATAALGGLGTTGLLAERAAQAIFVPVLLGVAAIFSGLNIWIQLRYTRYHVQTTGVVITSGWLTRRRAETTYNKVTDVTISQGLFGRMFGYGTIAINTAGSNAAPVVFQGLAEPERIKGLIDAARRSQE